MEFDNWFHIFVSIEWILNNCDIQKYVCYKGAYIIVLSLSVLFTLKLYMYLPCYQFNSIMCFLYQFCSMISGIVTRILYVYIRELNNEISCSLTFLYKCWKTHHLFGFSLSNLHYRLLKRKKKVRMIFHISKCLLLDCITTLCNGKLIDVFTFNKPWLVIFTWGMKCQVRFLHFSKAWILYIKIIIYTLVIDNEFNKPWRT